MAWRISESGISVEKGRHSSGGGAFGSQASPAYTAAAVGVPGMTQVKLPNGAFGAMDLKKMPKRVEKSTPIDNIGDTPPKFNSSPLKIDEFDDWKTSFLLGFPIFRGELLNFRGVVTRAPP